MLQASLVIGARRSIMCTVQCSLEQQRSMRSTRVGNRHRARGGARDRVAVGRVTPMEVITPTEIRTSNQNLTQSFYKIFLISEGLKNTAKNGEDVSDSSVTHCVWNTLSVYRILQYRRFHGILYSFFTEPGSQTGNTEWIGRCSRYSIQA
jgi:hypothetical protein